MCAHAHARSDVRRRVSCCKVSGRCSDICCKIERPTAFAFLFLIPNFESVVQQPFWFVRRYALGGLCTIILYCTPKPIHIVM